MDILSDDLAMEVFVRLPVRSIMRLRCVSKAWNSLISELGRRHRDRLPPAMVGYIQQFFFHQKYTTTFTGIGRRSCYSNDALAAAGAGSGGPDSSFMPLWYAQENLDMRIVSVCNGLVLCEYRQQTEPYEYCHVVCNPATKRWKRLPETSDCDPVAVGFDQRLPRRRHYRVLGYDLDIHHGAGMYPGTDTYRFKMFVSETGSWADCPGAHRIICVHSRLEVAFYADGIFYILIISIVHNVAAVHLLAVGLEEPACRRIALPPGVWPDGFDGKHLSGWSNMGGVRPRLGSLDGVLRLAAATEDEILVWALEAGGCDRWVPKHAVDLLGVGRERLAEIGADPGLLSTVRFMEFHPDVDVIFLTSRGTVLSYHFGTLLK